MAAAVPPGAGASGVTVERPHASAKVRRPAARTQSRAWEISHGSLRGGGWIGRVPRALRTGGECGFGLGRQDGSPLYAAHCRAHYCWSPSALPCHPGALVSLADLRLSVLIAAYNEERTVAAVVERVRAVPLTSRSSR